MFCWKLSQKRSNSKASLSFFTFGLGAEFTLLAEGRSIKSMTVMDGWDRWRSVGVGGLGQSVTPKPNTPRNGREGLGRTRQTEKLRISASRDGRERYGEGVLAKASSDTFVHKTKRHRVDELWAGVFSATPLGCGGGGCLADRNH